MPDDPLDAIYVPEKPKKATHSPDPLDQIYKASAKPTREPRGALDPAGILATAAEGAGMGLPHQLAGVVDAILSPSSYVGPKGSVAKNYWEGRSAIEKPKQEYEQDNRLLGNALEFGSGIVGANKMAGAVGLAKTIPTVLRMVIEGAGLGGLTAANQADLTKPADVARNAALGAGVGAVLGPSIGGPAGWLAEKVMGTRAGSTLADWLASKGQATSDLQAAVGKTGRSAKLITQALGTEGQTPATIQRQVADATAMSGAKPERLGDYSPAIRGLTREAAKDASPQGVALRSDLEARNAATPLRAAADVERYGNNPANASADYEALVQERDNLAKQMFGAAYRSGLKFDDPDILNFLQKNPTGRELWAKAQNIAASQPRQLPRIKVETQSQESAGPKSFFGPGTTPATQTAPDVFENPVLQKLVEQAKPQDRPALVAKLKEQGAALKPSQALPASASNVTVTTSRNVPVPDTRAMHDVFQLAQRRIETGFDENGKALLPGQSENLQHLVSRMKAQMEQHGSGLPEAMRTYETLSNQIGAANAGKNFRNFATEQGTAGNLHPMAVGEGDPQALANDLKGISGMERAFQRMTPDEIAYHRQNMQQALRQDILGGKDATVLDKMAATTPEARRWQALMFDSPEQMYRWFSSIERERAMGLTSAAADVTAPPIKGPNETTANAAVQGAAHSYSVDPRWVAMHAVRGVGRHMMNPFAGLGSTLAEQLNRSPQDILALLQSAQRGREGELANILKAVQRSTGGGTAGYLPSFLPPATPPSQ